MKWILISKKLPPIEKEVLIYTVYGTERVWSRTGHSEEGSFWEDEYGYWAEKDEVIAWMHLPKPPVFKRSKA